MAEEPSQQPVGSVLVLGAGVAGIRAANDLAVIGYEVYISDRVAETRALLSRLGEVGQDERCGLCQMVPKNERKVAAYFCMRKSLVAFSDRIAPLGEVVISRQDGAAAFTLAVEGEDERSVDAVIVGGSALEDPQAEAQLASLAASLGPADALEDQASLDGITTAVPGLFACGPAAGAIEIDTALISGSAAASLASRYLHHQGCGFVSDIKRVDVSDRQSNLRTIPVVKQALVVGGNAAGLRAALSLADRGVEVQLVEAGAALSGDAAAQRAVTQSEHVTVHLEADVVQASGTVGRFLTVIRRGDEELLLPHGATILSSNGAGEENVRVAKLFNLEHDEQGNLQEASRWKPVDFLNEGLYLARLHDAPSMTFRVAEAAAHRAFRYLSKREITTARVIARVSEEICSSCNICLSLCPYEARSEDEPGGKILVNERVCEGCGVCAANCPDDATTLVGTADEQTMAMIDSALEDFQKILP